MKYRIRGFIVGFIIIGLCCTSFSEDSVNTSFELFISALRDFEKEDYASSLNMLNKSIQMDSSKEEAFVKRAEIFEILHKNDEALMDYNRALILRPNFDYVLFRRSKLLFDKGNTNQALNDINLSLELRKDFVEGYFRRGEIYYQLKRQQSAIIDFTKVISLDPKFVDAYLARAELFMDIKEYAKSFADLNKVLELDTKNVIALFSRGRLYEEIGEHTKAIEDYEHTLILTDLLPTLVKRLDRLKQKVWNAQDTVTDAWAVRMQPILQ